MKQQGAKMKVTEKALLTYCMYKQVAETGEGTHSSLFHSPPRPMQLCTRYRQVIGSSTEGRVISLLWEP